MSSPLQVLSRRVPDITREHIEDLVGQLNDMRLTNIRTLKTMMTGSGAENTSTSITNYGKRFLKYLER